MTLLFDGQIPATLPKLIADYALPDNKGCRLEAWVFSSQADRTHAERIFRDAGISAQLHSAYKPLLHFFMERVDVADLDKITIRYPVHDEQPVNRFLLETYPLAAITEKVELRFEQGERNSFYYEVVLTNKKGKTLRHKVFIPSRIVLDPAGNGRLTPTGWLRLERDGIVQEDRQITTDYEVLFQTAIKIIQDHAWREQEPYFETLAIKAGFPCAETKIGYAEEAISLQEALHEDLYFSVLEVFQKKSNRPAGDRKLQPGQIVPEIVGEAATPFLRIETQPLNKTESLVAPQEDIALAVKPLGADQIRQIVTDLGGGLFSVESRSGRSVLASHHKGRDAAVMISAGQHANETTGIIGALRAADRLAQQPASHFVLSPLENPDGYELHHRLRKDNPCHMHHAARYTALGDDLEYRTEGNSLYEKGIRLEAEKRSHAKLHVNLHGYPSHEWTRPFSGYIPHGFDMWTIPKGFFLVMRHHADWAQIARQLIEQVTKHLIQIPGLVEFNRRQIDLYTIHAGQTGFEFMNGFPCLVNVDERQTFPVTLITEYPDETIYGDGFIAGHTAQMETVLAAYHIWQDMYAKNQVMV